MFHEVGMARLFSVAYCGLKIITSLRSVSLIFSEGRNLKL
jgi:hypothetical protein